VLSRTGKLNDSTVNRFAMRHEYANVIAALSLLSGATVETISPLMDEIAGEGLIIACRASRLNWQTTSAVLNNRRVPPLSKQQLEDARQMFEMLFVSTAQYTIRFEPPYGSASTSSQNIAVAGGRV
jgi:acetylornithine/succinyldiaminopimelate/putrescine aminotransferase